MKKYLFHLLLAFNSFIYAQDFPVLKGAYLGQEPPDDIPELFAPGIITGFIHGYVAISPTGDEIYWVVNTGKEQIFFSKIENGIWTKPALAEFNSTGHNSVSAFSPDGMKLFFYSDDRPGGIGGFDAWYVQKTDGGWSEPINVGKPYNSINDDSPPFFTEKGYAYRISGFRENKLFDRFKYSAGKFSDPVPESTIPEYGPWWTLFISPGEDYLIFASGAGNADLYIRFKNKEGKWGTPMNMGDKINTGEWERFPVVSPDGRYLFFTRGGGTISKLFWVSTEVINKLKADN